jgi:hypothetical protein
MNFDKETIRPASRPAKGDEIVKPMPVESVRFTVPHLPGKECVLNIADFTSGAAMVEAAAEWAAKQ